MDVWRNLFTTCAITVAAGLWPATGLAEACTGRKCSELGSCREAVYETYVCGYSQRDRDHDGVPCETLCSAAAAQEARAALGLD